MVSDMSTKEDAAPNGAIRGWWKTGAIVPEPTVVGQRFETNPALSPKHALFNSTFLDIQGDNHVYNLKKE
jgi:hypothetical protein